MTTSASGARTEYVTYGPALRAFQAQPQGAGPFPTVILLHERYGLFQHTLDLAERFAREGYLCLAPDLYSRVEEQTALRAGDITIPLPDPQVRADLDAGISYLKGLSTVDASRLAIMGVCLTGRYPITVGAYRDDLAALVVFYGGAGPKEWPVTDTQPEPLESLFAKISAPVLGVFGERDHVVPIPDVLRFRNCLEAARKSYEITIYPNVPHGWLNDHMPGRYRADEAEQAWQQMKAFLERTFDGGYPKDRVKWVFDGDISADYDPSKNVRLA